MVLKAIGPVVLPVWARYVDACLRLDLGYTGMLQKIAREKIASKPDPWDKRRRLVHMPSLCRAYGVDTSFIVFSNGRPRKRRISERVKTLVE